MEIGKRLKKQEVSRFTEHAHRLFYGSTFLASIINFISSAVNKSSWRYRYFTP
jgi:hypothetical protein